MELHQPLKSDLDAKTEQIKRPISIWIVYVVSILITVATLFSLAVTVINIASFFSVPDGPGSLIKLLAINFAILAFVLPLIFSVYMRKFWGWHLSIIFALIISLYISAKLFSPELFPQSTGTEFKDDGVSTFQMIGIAIIYLFTISLFKPSIKKYFSTLASDRSTIPPNPNPEND